MSKIKDTVAIQPRTHALLFKFIITAKSVALTIQDVESAIHAHIASTSRYCIVVCNAVDVMSLPLANVQLTQ